jgi:peroxiredoxin
MKVQVGQKIPPFVVKTLNGQQLSVPDGAPAFTHLQFRRFAGCPICNFHLHSFFKGARELDAAGIREVVVFHSSRSEMEKYQKDITFAAVADPEKKLYAKFGVGTSLTASLHPKALLAAIKGIFLKKIGLKMENGPLGLPADILLDRSGTVVAAKYGKHAYDQWELPELLRIATTVASARNR